MIKVSVITVCRNEELTINATLKSVLHQTYNNIEYVVIDGDSNDKTKDVIKQYKNKIYFISEPDRGIFDAMNKGIQLASGKLLIFMNSGDCFYDDDVISRIVKQATTTDADVIYGEAYWVKTKELRDYSNVDIPFLTFDSICHQAMITKKSAFATVGLFDTSLQISADYDWILKSKRKYKLKYVYTPILIVKYKGDGVSSNKDLFNLERNIILNRYFNKYELFVYHNFYKIEDFLRKRIRLLSN